VSFTKGCYVGQEVVTRIEHQGHLNKKLCGLVLEGAAIPARGATIVVADDYAQALAMLAAGEADAFAGDDILLAAFVAERGLQRQYAVVGELLSYEPYGIMFARDDPALAQAVDAAFRRLAASRELRWIYNKWFLRALPSGVRLGLPMSAELQRSFEILGLPPE
jgi:glutamate/aspartate transport system substrate-binding protein